MGATRKIFEGHHYSYHLVVALRLHRPHEYIAGLSGASEFRSRNYQNGFTKNTRGSTNYRKISELLDGQGLCQRPTFQEWCPVSWPRAFNGQGHARTLRQTWTRTRPTTGPITQVGIELLLHPRRSPRV